MCVRQWYVLAVALAVLAPFAAPGGAVGVAPGPTEPAFVTAPVGLADLLLLSNGGDHLGPLQDILIRHQAGVRDLLDDHERAEQPSRDGRDGVRSTPGPGGGPDTLAGAVRALYAQLDVPIPRDVSESLDAATVPADLDHALADLVNLHTHQVRETRRLLDDHGPWVPSDLAVLRDQTLAGVLAGIDGLRTASHGDPLTIDPCTSGGVLALDLRGEDSVHACPAHLSIDLGGDDRYENNAGGTPLPMEVAVIGWPHPLDASVPTPAGLALDLAGDDHYTGRRGGGAATGGAIVGTGLLVDAAGDDRYEPWFDGIDATTGQRVAANGGAAAGGAGGLVDLGGTDRYAARLDAYGATNGAALDVGRGLLVDADGDDEYHSDLSMGGASDGAGDLHGVGFLLDLSGNDKHTTDVSGTAFVQGAAGLGTGVLVDRAGADVYETTLPAGGATQGAAMGGGAGVLLDLGTGRDTFTATLDGVGVAQGAALAGTGLLLDEEGAGTWRADGAALRASQGAAEGVFLTDSDEIHWLLLGEPLESVARAIACGGIAVETSPHLLGDGCSLTIPVNDCDAGNLVLPDCEPIIPPSCSLRRLDSCRPGPAPVNQSVHLASTGLLLTGPGDAEYTATRGLAQGAAQLYAFGALLDAGGVSSYVGGPGALAQGYGAFFGVGVLLDAGRSAVLDLGVDAFGHGTGLQGIGALIRPNPIGHTTYAADSAHVQAFSGAGVGLIVDEGTAMDLPHVECIDRDPIIDTAAPGPDGNLVRFILCPRDEAHKEVIVDPITQKRLTVRDPTNPEDDADGSVWKPSVRCDGTPAPESCSQLMYVLLGDKAEAWFAEDHMNSTTGGGITLTSGSDDDEGNRTTARMMQPTADRTCWPGCYRLDQLLGVLGSSLGGS